MNFNRKRAYDIVSGLLLMLVEAQEDEAIEISARFDEIIAGTTEVTDEIADKLREMGWDYHPDVDSWRYQL